MPQTKNIPFWAHSIWERALLHPVGILCAVAFITVVFACAIPQLSFKTTIQDLILEDLPATAEYRDFKSVFGSDEMIRAVVRCQNIFSPETFPVIEDLSQRFLRIDGVLRVISLAEIKKTLELTGEWDLERLKTVIAPVDLFSRNLISLDHRATTLTLILDAQRDKDAIIRQVQNIIQTVPKTISLYQIGMPIVSKTLADYTRQDFLRLPPITLSIIALLLLFLLGNPVGLIIPVSTVLLCLVWSLGLMAFFHIPLSMLTMIVPVFLIGVATCYCMVIYTEFLKESRNGLFPEEALRVSFGRMILPVMLAVLTTLIGIASLFINRIIAIREFALFACSGIISLTILLMTYYPAVISLFPPRAQPIRMIFNIEPVFHRILSYGVQINLRHQKAALSIIGGITLLGAIGVFFIEVETNPISFFKENTPVYRDFHDIYRDLSGSFPVHVVMKGPEPDFFEDPEHLMELSQLQKFLETLPGVDKSVSMADYLKLVNYASNHFESKFYALPEASFEIRMLSNDFKMMLGEDMLTRFMSQDFSQANVLMLTHLSSSNEFLSMRERILAHVHEQFPKNIGWQVTGLGMVISDSSQQLTLGQIKSLALSLSLIFAIMVTLFVSFRVGLIALLPNIFPILVNFGIMGWFGIKLSMVTSMVASIAIGLAVDDTIHYLVRYNTEFKKDLDKDRAMRDTLLGIGKPIIYSTLTLCLGVCVLVFSHFKPTAVFGFLMIVIMLSALVANLILLPTLLLHVELVTAWDLLRHMPAVGGLPPAMVHEINQPLNAIKLGSEFLKMMLKKGGEIQRDQLAAVSKEISNQVDRASQIIRQFGDFDQKPLLEKEPVDINAPIRGVLSILSNPLRLDNIDLRVELADPLPKVLGNYNRLSQVLFHLMTNAWESFRPESGVPGTVKPRQITVRTLLEKGQVMVEISDTGAGIDLHLKDRVFEPFFTTKSPGKGKGLGLSVCRQIVRDHRGEITIETVPGQGTCVRISFTPINLY